jgi:hypothetical protein
MFELVIDRLWFIFCQVGFILASYLVDDGTRLGEAFIGGRLLLGGIDGCSILYEKISSVDH